MKSVLISIQPYWVFLIISKAMGWKVDKEKTIEVRKNLPKDANWDKSVKVYCSKDGRSFSMIPKEYQPAMKQFLGKVVGEFVCDKTFDICIEVSDPDDLPGYPFPCTGLTDKEILQYLGNGKTGYGWHISQLKIYDDPKPLWKFMKCGALSEKELDEELCSYCEQTEWGERRSYGTPSGPVMCEGAFCGEAYDLYLDEHFALKRPPQSWCYVEELKDNG